VRRIWIGSAARTMRDRSMQQCPRVRPRIRPRRADQPAVGQLNVGWMFAPALHHVAEFDKSVEQYPNIAPGADFDGYS
jgi:hypothetical protein